jgi:anti-sigma regulatory factor (Ser/Thr protein kinase)
VSHSPTSDSCATARVPVASGIGEPHGVGPAFRADRDTSLEPGSSDWPLRSRLVLGALPSAVPCARLHARQVLWEWGVAGLAESVELLVSELITNAIRASADATPSQYGMPRTGLAPVVELCLACDRSNVLVRVRDSSPETPTRRDADLDAEGGRGLLLVEHLSARWGTYTTEASTGKVVWALVTQATL